MECLPCFYFAFSLLLLNTINIKPSSAAITRPNSATDRDALLSLRAATSADPQSPLARNWSADTSNPNICHLFGVSCGARHRRVTALNISGFALTGSLPHQLWNLTFLTYFDINIELWMAWSHCGKQLFVGLHAIFHLQHTTMIYLDLSSNQFSGKIPAGLCDNLPHLQLLYLLANKLEGRIPSNIDKCRKLERLSLSINHLNGEIPIEIGNLSMLRELYLGFSFLKGGIPGELGSLSQLEMLHIAQASLPGPIPNQIGNCTSLKHLRLGYNYLTGELPLQLGNLASLKTFTVFSNSLSGSIPPCIFNVSTLKRLELSSNQFSGHLPPGPTRNLGNVRKLIQQLRPNLENLRQLRHLNFYKNNLTGAKSEDQELGFLSSLNSCRHLKRLSLSLNPLKGIFPSSVGNLSTSLSYFGTSYCDIKGVIPPEFRNLSASNKLNSTIPSGLWNLRDLLFLNLSSNYLSGGLSSELASFTAISFIDFSHNQLSGDIPISIDSCRSLESLFLSNNEFEGAIPKSLGNIRGMRAVDLSSNNLSGPIPETLQDVSLLQYFNVCNNKLAGPVPSVGRFINFTADSFLNNLGLCGQAKFHVPLCVEKNFRRKRAKKIVWVLKYILPPFVSITLAAAVIILFIRRRIYKRGGQLMLITTDDDTLLGIACRRFTYIELSRGTNGFSEANLLGRGSFGSVFRGTLSDGSNIAIKVFDSKTERVVCSFETETEILSKVRHRNLVRMVGCCSNSEFKALILEYMPNGSLEKWLCADDRYLSLMQRLQIAIEVALALEYLHHGYTFPIVHCDVKPSNVLLGEDMVACLGDFGIAKLLMQHQSMSERKVSTSGDVYSFGILLLEIFTGKKPTEDMFDGKTSLKEWVYGALQNNAANEVLAPDLLAREREYSRRMSLVYFHCGNEMFGCFA
ncbi:leucine-rich receptor-like protein kinase family protein [Striga asiatica]|uniref:Leucine-rich receptor-like protein kinase family protein n=1 Tax=Striga asiatica TaxID=4170 RepID=A0A5A7P6J8_STRAF|nr:leucine-rich receptor-like protein kinase family protein [Striga asiatica]